VLVLIYILMVGWFNSFLTPLIVMVVILFSLIGVLPAHGLLRAFFTATSMIGFMAGAGIVVHNSIILVDFIEMRLAEGHPLAEAVVEAGMIPNDDVVKDFDLEKLTGTNEAACDLDSRTLHK
jgi:multidrug efflux pump subunit AcrB